MWADAIVKPYVVTFRTSIANATPPPPRSFEAASDDPAADAMGGSLNQTARRPRFGGTLRVSPATALRRPCDGPATALRRLSRGRRRGRARAVGRPGAGEGGAAPSRPGCAATRGPRGRVARGRGGSGGGPRGGRASRCD